MSDDIDVWADRAPFEVAVGPSTFAVRTFCLRHMQAHTALADVTHAILHHDDGIERGMVAHGSDLADRLAAALDGAMADDLLDLPMGDVFSAAIDIAGSYRRFLAGPQMAKVDAALVRLARATESSSSPGLSDAATA
jgi:hypothetical protein